MSHQATSKSLETTHDSPVSGDLEVASYRKLCATEESIPIFMRDWWLDAVCGSRYWNVLLEEERGKVLAAMPLYKPGKRVVAMPQYTQFMGVWFASEPPDMKYSSKIAHRQAICRKFVDALQDQKVFLQNFSYDFTDWLPFYWKGYSQTTKYTYIIENLKDLAVLHRNMSQQVRRNIRKAERLGIEVRRGVPVDDFVCVQNKTFERQNMKNRQSEEVLRRLIHIARERKQGEIFGGYDGKGDLHAAAFVVWQKSSAYYIAGGGDPAYRDSGAHSLVMWKALEFVSDCSEVFDFEGSMIEGVERFFREFGAVQKPYFVISRGRLSLLDRLLIKKSMGEWRK